LQRNRNDFLSVNKKGGIFGSALSFYPCEGLIPNLIGDSQGPNYLIRIYPPKLLDIRSFNAGY